MTVADLDRKLYPSYEDNWDDEWFREAILHSLSSDMNVLDVGAGAGIVSQMNFRGMVRKVCGVDLDPRVTDNPHLDEGRVASAESLPYADGTFDLVFSDNVLEHLDAPETVFREVNRVLRSGGRFLIKTPNRFHYVPLIATLTPHSVHRWVNKRRGRDVDDTFPTRYRANSERKLKKLAAECGFRIHRLQLIEGRPEYLRFNALTYYLGWVYERVVNAFELLRSFRVLIIAEFVKTEDSPNRGS